MLIAFVYSHPGYFGKKGIRHFHQKKAWLHNPTINVEKLWNLVPEEARKNSTKDKAAVIDTTKAVSILNINIIINFVQGYFKVLGKGSLPKVPFILKTRMISKMAEKRIKEAGGACVLTA